MGWNPFKGGGLDPSRIINDVRNQIQGAANGIKNQVEQGVRSVGKQVEEYLRAVQHDAEKGVRNVEKAVAGTLQDTASKAQAELTAAAGKAKTALTEKLPALAEKAVQDAIQAGAAKIAKESLEAGLAIVKVAVPASLALQLGPVGFSISGIVDKIELLERWAANPPKGREQILAAVVEFDPGEVSITAEAQLALVLVSSESLSVGVTATWSAAEFVKNGDALLQRMGL